MAVQPNRSRNAVLGFLCWGPMSGYDLRGVIEGSISNFWSESSGRIYPILAQLVDEGLARRTATQSPGGRPRHVYRITDEGRADFDAWLREPVAPRPPRNELLLKLFFGARTQLEVPLEMLRAHRFELEERLDHYAEIRERLEAAKDAPEDRAFWLMTLRFGELDARAQLDWCDEVLPQLEASRSEQGAAR